MKKGSSCIEALRAISHRVSCAFGNEDAHRKSKESDAQADIRALANNLASSSVYQPTPNRVVPAPPSKGSKSKEIRVHANRSAVVDIYERGLELAGSTGKVEEYLRATTWDPLLGYPLDKVDHHESGLPPTNTIFDETNENPIELTTDDCFEGEGDIGSAEL